MLFTILLNDSLIGFANSRFAQRLDDIDSPAGRNDFSAETRQLFGGQFRCSLSVILIDLGFSYLFDRLN